MRVRLVKDEASTAGRYVNTAWRAGEPGTFAVVIGVSAYAHLGGGAAPAAETYGLGQLYVSALTAYDFFEWLAVDDGSPAQPAQCWLLLSPTAAEVAARRELGGAGAPATYLEQVHGGVNDAISTANLVNGVACLPVPHHSFFVDACRNDVTRLREQRLEGSRILDETISRNANQDVVAPVLFATSAGTAAYQYQSVDKRSIYGTALLEGLRGDQGIELDCDQQGCNVWIFRLQSMMKRRVEMLVRQASGGEQGQSQRILLGGYVDDLTVTRVSVPAPAGPPPPPPPPRGPALAGMGAQPRERAYEVEPMATPWRLAVDDFNVGHDMLGSEQLTELLLRGAEVTPLDGGDRTALSTVGAVISSVTRSEDTRRLTIALQLPHADAGWWLRVPSVDGTVWTVALPGDLEAVTYLLDLHTEFPPGDGRVRSLTHMDAALALTGNGFLTQAAAAWWAYDTQSTGAAVELVDEQHLIELLLHKVRSPLGATIAAHLLLEVRSHRIPRQWLQNLTDWFDRPDPPVLLAEHALREHDDSSWLDALELVGQRGLPHLSADVARLDAHVAELGRRDDLPGAAGLRSALAVPLAEAIARLRPGGLFATYFGDMDELDVRFLKPFR